VDFKVVCGGETISEHEMDTRIFVESYLSLSSVIEESDTMVNGDDFQVFTKLKYPTRFI
jgi:hypothetical protein